MESAEDNTEEGIGPGVESFNMESEKEFVEKESSGFFRPAVKTIQRIALYETKSRFYVVGSNNTQSSFRVLKIDRLDPKNLNISDDKTLYNNREIRDLLTMIDVGNRSKIGQKIGSGLTRTVSAFGIAGFVRFLEGYYIVLITKRRKVGVIGQHTIYKIEDTSMLYIPHDTIKEQHSDEQRYLKMFQAIDLSSNFYFSYSYDLTHTLQHNLANPNFLSKSSGEKIPLGDIAGLGSSQFSYISQFQSKFVWNEYLMQGMDCIDPEWILPIVHGFVDQSNVSIYGKPIYVTLIARRSKKYAGTRFLKRGANNSGDVANEVETEQIACDASIGSDRVGHYTSFVHMRGSVPAHWAQDISKIQPKPPIFIETQDPYAEVAGKHFNQLLARYGSPVVVINLVKKRERRKHESLLSEEFLTHINYLNQFLPAQHRIQYCHFDMARCNKKTDANVMGRLGDIAYRAVKKVGIFHNRATSYLQQSRGGRQDRELLDSWRDRVGRDAGNIMKQTGIIRTNCVDCLDRTNTAQFSIGLCALGFQLHALGVLEVPRLETDTDCVRMLEEMYEDHGDTLALQYGGSALIHRIKTYRKQSPWTSKGNDIMQTMRRYYSNTLSDAEKQNTMNIFLGVFLPSFTQAPIWERDYNSDYYLHHPVGRYSPSLSQWWDNALVPHLPLPKELADKTCTQLVSLQSSREALDDYYRPFELTELQNLFAFSEINHSVRDFMPNFTTDFSPFSARTRLGKKREEMSSSKTNLATKNPSVAGNSTSSTTSTEEDSDESNENNSEDEDDGVTSMTEESVNTVQSGPTGMVSFESLFPITSMAKVRPPSSSDMQLYRSMSSLSKLSGPPMVAKRVSSTALPHPLARNIDRSAPCPIPVHDYSKQLLRPVSEESMRVFENHVRVGREGATTVSEESLEIYRKYVSMAGILA